MGTQNRYIKATSSNGGGSNSLIYSRPIPTGQVSVYATYDDAWMTINRPDTYLPTSGILIGLQLYKVWRLTTNNTFNNNFRYTGLNGAYWDPDTSLYYIADGTSTTTFASAFPDYYVIDHYTGLAWIALASASNVTWTTALSDCIALTTSGFNDWMLPNVNHLVSIMDLSYVYPLGNSTYPTANVPFHNVSNGTKWTSTTIENTNTRAYVITPTGGVATNVLKSGVGRYIPVRYHFS